MRHSEAGLMHRSGRQAGLWLGSVGTARPGPDFGRQKVQGIGSSALAGLWQVS